MVLPTSSRARVSKPTKGSLSAPVPRRTVLCRTVREGCLRHPCPSTTALSMPREGDGKGGRRTMAAMGDEDRTSAPVQLENSSMVGRLVDEIVGGKR